jgi:hypothetical protein
VPRVDILRELAVVPVQAGGHDPQLEQIRGVQARLDEGAGALEPIHRDVGQAWAGQPPAGEIRHLPQGFQHRVADDARVRPPPASSGVGQNLAAAAMLLRAMPEPSTTKGRRIQGELKNLLEGAVVRRAESSASRRQGYPSEPHAAASRSMREASVYTGRTRNTAPTAPGRLDNEHVPSLGKYPLVVDPVIGDVRLTKVLMDGGSSLNIIYAETLGLLRVDLSSVRAGAAPFHGIIPGKRVQPLGRLDLPVCFGTPSNFRRETLTFEVVGFRGTYHAVLGRPCYAKFMAVPNYTYLKLKMPGPNGVITVGPTYKHAFECDVECVEYVEALAESEALIADLESLSKEVPDVKRHAGNFEPVETVKAVPLDPSGDVTKQIRIDSGLDPK